jgi:hypothetical protein
MSHPYRRSGRQVDDFTVDLQRGKSVTVVKA